MPGQVEERAAKQTGLCCLTQPFCAFSVPWRVLRVPSAQLEKRHHRDTTETPEPTRTEPQILQQRAHEGHHPRVLGGGAHAAHRVLGEVAHDVEGVDDALGLRSTAGVLEAFRSPGRTVNS